MHSKLVSYHHKVLIDIPARFLQNPTRSCRILQDLVGMQEERTFSCNILQEHFYWAVTMILASRETQGLTCKRYGDLQHDAQD